MLTEISKEITKQRSDKKTGRVTNFMGGDSFNINPLETLKMVTASSIFGEPQYYRDGEFAEKGVHSDSSFSINEKFAKYSILEFDNFKNEFGEALKTSEVMERVIDAALDYDYKSTILWAQTLRIEYKMRLNPQIIMVRAAIHAKRENFTKTNPGLFNKVNQEVMSRADDVIAQVTYYIYINKSKKNIPNILKRSWAKKINSLSAYEMAKYKNKGIGMIDAVRICHANNKIIDELMNTGTVLVDEKDKTWEVLRASGMSWEEIFNTIKMNHMALLRNLRGIFTEIDDLAHIDNILETLKCGVKGGKQYPFRYMSALKANKKGLDESPEKLVKVSDALNECLDIACDNLPHLAGNNAFLSDNSGSAWNTCTSQYGTVTIADIDNLSAVIGAANSDSGTVIAFGNEMVKHPISKRDGILNQATMISKDAQQNIGQDTECGIWLFFDEAIKKGIHYDNIFIYSDMQAGHGRLYGTDDEVKRYGAQYGIKNCGLMYINVPKLIEKYRKDVNPKVNVFCIQTAGYTNVMVPEYGYRTNILYGWTGEELVFADIMNKFWDEYDKTHEKELVTEHDDEEIDNDLELE